jgi:hypothetical protein
MEVRHASLLPAGTLVFLLGSCGASKTADSVPCKSRTACDDTATTDDSGTDAARIHLELPAGLVLDPKLEGGVSLPVRIVADALPSKEACTVTLEATDSLGAHRTWPSSGLSGGSVDLTFDGLNDEGRFFDPGRVRLQASITCDSTDGSSAQAELWIVRLGVVRIDFEWASDGGNVVIAFHEIDESERGVTVLDVGLPEYQSGFTGPDDVADLDENDGSPRTVVEPWTNPDFPPWGDDTDRLLAYNVPAAYVAGSTMRIAATVGSTAVGSTDEAVSAFGEDPPTVPIRLVAGGWTPVDPSAMITPGAIFSFDSAPLTLLVGRQDLEITWSFESLTDDGWIAIPGSQTTTHRVYRLAGEPVPAGEVQPWIGALEEMDPFVSGLGTDPGTLLTALRNGLFYGGYHYGGGGFGGTSGYCPLSDWLDRSDGAVADCYGISAILSVLAGMLGIDAPQTVLILAGTNPLKAAGQDLWAFYAFTTHSVVRTGDDRIWDAALNPDGDDDPASEPILDTDAVAMPFDVYSWHLAPGTVAVMETRHPTFE